jgi:hypothetical protein
LLRLTVLVECGTRAILGAVFGPEADGETTQANRLLDCLGRGMLVLADAGYDSWRFLATIAARKAHFLCRSGARRTPLILRRLSDGSYLSVLGYGRLKVRIVEAWVTVTWVDGTITREQWRLVTSLLDHRRYPASALVELYHRRWQVDMGQPYCGLRCDRRSFWLLGVGIGWFGQVDEASAGVPAGGAATSFAEPCQFGLVGGDHPTAGGGVFARGDPAPVDPVVDRGGRHA